MSNRDSLIILNISIVLAGKLAAEVVSERAAGLSHRVGEKEIQADIWSKSKNSVAKDPIGIFGEGPFPFGGGGVMTADDRDLLMKSDPDVFE